jgi:Peptidase S24-like
MKNEFASGGGAGQDAQAYQSAAREAWHTGEATGSLRLTVTTNSMRPLLRAGDRVVVQPIDPYALRPGDVIVVQRGGEWITHRLVAADAHGWRTHGDNACYGDEAASAAQIVGRVIAIERNDQTIDLLQPRWRVIDRRINRVQRLQLRVLAAARAIGGTRQGLAALISWPFQLLVRMVIRV